MADLEKVVSILFKGVDDLSPQIKGMEKALGGLNSGINDATQPIADLSKSILSLEAGLIALSAGGMAAAVIAAGQFGDQFSEITTLFDATGTQVDEFRNDILEYATSSTQSIDQLNQAVYSAISAGTEYDKSLALVRQSEQLSVAGKADLNASTILLASTLNAYGLATTEAQRVSDVFFQTVRLGQTTIPELASSLSNVTGIAASANVPIETLGAGIAALTAAGNPTSQAITGIKAALDNIIKPSEAASRLADELGIQFNASAIEAKGFEGVLADVARATKGNVDTTAQLFGSTEALNTVLTLTSVDTAPKFQAALKSMSESAGSTEEAYAKMADSFANTNQRIGNNIQTVLIAAGEELQDDYKGIADGIVSIFQGLKIGFDEGAFSDVFAALDNFSEGISEYLKQVADVLPEALSGVDFSGLIDSFGSLGEAIKGAFEALFGAVDLTTVDGLQAAIQKVVNVFENLTRVSAGIIEKFTPILSAIGKAGEGFSGLEDSVASAIGALLGIGSALNTVTGFFDKIAPILSTVTSLLTLKFITGAGGATAALTALKGAAASLIPVLGAGVAGAAGYGVGSLLRMVPGIDEATQKIAELTDKIFDWTGSQRENAERTAQATAKVYRFKIANDELAESVDNLPAQKNITVTATDPDADEVRRILEARASGAAESINTAAKKAVEMVQVKVGDELREYPVYVYPDPQSLDATAEEIENVSDRVKIQVEYDKERLRQEAETAQKAMEFAVSVKTAEAELELGRIKAVAENVSGVFENTGESIGNALSLLTESNGISTNLKIRDVLDEERKMRKEQFELQKKLVEAEIDLAREKTERLNQGEPMITVTADGLEPELEAFMWRILERVQIRANELYSEFLLGVS